MSSDSFSDHRQDNATLVRPERTAVLVIDMLNDFCVAGGAMVLPGYEALLAPQRQVIAAARAAGAPVVYVVDAHRPGLAGDREFAKRTPHCIEGTWGAQVIDELAPETDDHVVTKRRYSGFYDTDLDLTLRDLRVEHVIAMGVVTNICVRSTVHDAFFRGYDVVVPEDCVAATGPREQASSLYDIATHFGTVADADAVERGLRQGAPIENRIVDPAEG